MLCSQLVQGDIIPRGMLKRIPQCISKNSQAYSANDYTSDFHRVLSVQCCFAGILLHICMVSKSISLIQTRRLNILSGLQLELTLSGELEERCDERPRLVVVPPYSDLGLGGSVDELWSI